MSASTTAKLVQHSPIVATLIRVSWIAARETIGTFVAKNPAAMRNSRLVTEFLTTLHQETGKAHHRKRIPFAVSQKIALECFSPAWRRIGVDGLEVCTLGLASLLHLPQCRVVEFRRNRWNNGFD